MKTILLISFLISSSIVKACDWDDAFPVAEKAINDFVKSEGGASFTYGAGFSGEAELYYSFPYSFKFARNYPTYFGVGTMMVEKSTCKAVRGGSGSAEEFTVK